MPVGLPAPVGFGRGREFRRVEPGEDELINGIANEPAVLDSGRFWIRDGLEGPEVQPLAAENFHDGIARIVPGVAELFAGFQR